MIITIASGLEKSTSPFLVVIAMYHCYDGLLVRKQQALVAGEGQSNAFDTVPFVLSGFKQSVSGRHSPPLLWQSSNPPSNFVVLPVNNSIKMTNTTNAITAPMMIHHMLASALVLYRK